MMFVKPRALCAKIWRNIGPISRITSISLVWLFSVFLIIDTYCREVADASPGVIPSFDGIAALTLVWVALVIMGLELLVVGWLWRPWKRGMTRQAICLASLNFFWGVLWTRIDADPPYPFLWHLGWLLLLEIVLVVDISIAVMRWLLRSVYRAIRRLLWSRIRWR